MVFPGGVSAIRGGGVATWCTHIKTARYFVDVSFLVDPYRRPI